MPKTLKSVPDPRVIRTGICVLPCPKCHAPIIYRGKEETRECPKCGAIVRK